MFIIDVICVVCYVLCRMSDVPNGWCFNDHQFITNQLVKWSYIYVFMFFAIDSTFYMFYIYICIKIYIFYVLYKKRSRKRFAPDDFWKYALRAPAPAPASRSRSALPTALHLTLCLKYPFMQVYVLCILWWIIDLCMLLLYVG